METRYPLSDATETAAVVQATQRWLERAVIGLNLCPFARGVYLKRQIRFAATAASTPDELLEALAAELQWLAATDAAQCETTLLIHPHVLGEFLDFHFFLAEAQALIARLELDGVFQLASFHPHYEFAGSTGTDPANYTNRAPYPILHLLREASVERAVQSVPDAALIYQRNLQTLRELGHAGWRKLWS